MLLLTGSLNEARLTKIRYAEIEIKEWHWPQSI